MYLGLDRYDAIKAIERNGFDWFVQNENGNTNEYDWDQPKEQKTVVFLTIQAGGVVGASLYNPEELDLMRE